MALLAMLVLNWDISKMGYFADLEIGKGPSEKFQA